MRPRPAQRPHPPLYMAANSEDSVRSAARLGLPTLSAFFVPIDELRRRHDVYREEASAVGISDAEIEQLEREAWGMRVVHVAADRDEALRATEAPFMGYQERLAQLRSEATGGSLPDSFDRSFVRLRPFREYLDSGVALIGSADEVRHGLQAYLDLTGPPARAPGDGAAGPRHRCRARSMRRFRGGGGAGAEARGAALKPRGRAEVRGAMRRVAREPRRRPPLDGVRAGPVSARGSTPKQLTG